MSIISEKNFDIRKLTSFKTGGIIKEVFYPESIEECENIFKNHPSIKVFGNLSNTLVSSDGYDGAIVLTAKMTDISINGNTVTAGAGVKGPKLAQTVCESGLSGLEFMIGFPGSVGGEVYMNASANSQAVSDTFVSALCYSKTKGIIRLSKDEMRFGYRSSVCQSEDLIVLQAEFELTPKSKDEIKAQMDSNLQFRKNHQPSLALPNCGSIFKNPQGNSAGRLLDSIGAKTLSCGGVRIWENHANFIVNDNCGTSLDILSLMFDLYSKVKEKYDIELEPEIIFLGGKNEKENELCKILYKK